MEDQVMEEIQEMWVETRGEADAETAPSRYTFSKRTTAASKIYKNLGPDERAAIDRVAREISQVHIPDEIKQRSVISL